MKIKERFTSVKTKVINILLLIKYFIIDTYGWVRSLFILVFKGVKNPGTFYGYKNLWFATMYGKKRTWLWRSWWNQAGKKQGVLPMDELTLITCSAMELKAFKKARIVNKNFNPRKAIKKSYFTTSI